MISPLLSLASIVLGAGANPAEHVFNHPWWVRDGWWLWSGNQGNLLLSALILVGGMWWVAGKVRTGPASQGNDRYVTTSRTAHLIEVIMVYLREEIVRPLLKDRTDKFMSFMWTVFFFVLINNILGLIPILDIVHSIERVLWIATDHKLGSAEPHSTPIGGTATQNIWVTGVLALIAGLVFNIAAIIRLGPGGFVKHMMGGLPWYMLPIALLLLVIEMVGQFVIKPGALAIRLFANMTAGHILIATLFLFAGQVWGRSFAIQGPVTVISVLGAIALTFLELFVAVLQAFVFMFLTAVFISLMDHGDEHGHEHGHDHAHGHEHAPAHA